MVKLSSRKYMEENVFCLKISEIFRGWKTNAAFTLNGFDDQERNLTFVKTDFQVYLVPGC